jgi:hypothetical protein
MKEDTTLLIVVGSDAPRDFLEHFARLLREHSAHARQFIWSQLQLGSEARIMLDVSPDAVGDQRLIESIRALPGVKDVSWMDQVYAPRRR